MKDLTKGKISTLILGFAIPVFLGNLLQLTYSLADTRIVGSFLGDPYHKSGGIFLLHCP